MPKISVIVPVYNVEEYLDVCLDTIIMQTFKDFEVICVDDGTQDSSGEILDKYALFDKRIKVIHQENKGLSGARNTGVEAANGEYIMFVDSDDYISPLILENLYKNVKQNKSDFVFCNLCIVRSDTFQTEVWDFLDKEKFFANVHGTYFCEEDMPPELYFNFHVCAYAKLYRHDFIKDFKFPQGLIFEDMPYFAQCYLNAKRISFDFNPYYFYRVLREGSIIQSADKRFVDIFKTQRLRRDIFKQSGKYDKYKNIILITQIKDLIQKLASTKGQVRQLMFNNLKEYYGDIDYTEFDSGILEKEKSYHFLRTILTMEYDEFNTMFESLIKNGGNNNA